jgi:exonuclease III
MRLKILSWNCQSLRSKIFELSDFLENNFYHFVLLQETWLNQNSKIHFPNYVCVRKDRNSHSRNPHGGVAILVHVSLKNNYAMLKPVDLDFVESIIIQVNLKNFNFTLGSIYSPATCRATDVRSDLEKLLSKPGPFILAGDYNAKHTSWNNSKSNIKGKHLLRICNEKFCEIHFSEETTVFPSTGELSLLDLVISKRVTGIAKPCVINGLSSDHTPISFEIPTSVDELPEKVKILNYAKADWKTFRSLANAKFMSIQNSQELLSSSKDIDLCVEEFLNVVNDACKASIPLKNPHGFRYPFSQKLKELSKRRNAIRNLYRRSPHLRYFKLQISQLNREIRIETELLRQQEWNKFVLSLDSQHLSLYRVAKSLKKKFAPLPPLKVADNLVYSNKEKAEAIAENFRNSHVIPSGQTVHSQEIDDSRKFVDGAPADFHESARITEREVQAIIDSLKIRKAPGHDEVSNKILKNLPPSASRLLAKVYNACLHTSYFPLNWKIGKVVAILKPGKDHTLPSSYRPITLLPTIGKIFEILILERLKEFEEEKKILKNQQFGFRSRHSTSQQILRITETISLRFNENKSTAMTLLDIEKAFDTVWHNALIHKLRVNAFPIYLVKIIVSFLQNRVSFVKIDDKCSENYYVPAGVPQGSPLSPFLFNIFINDLPVPKNCKIAVYADDTALTSSVMNYELPKLVRRMTSALTEMSYFFLNWKLKLNTAKTETILFTKSNKMKKLSENNRISINGNNLEWKNTAKYLGVSLDTKLTFKSHIAESHLKARKGMATLYPLLKKSSPLNRSSKLLLYKLYIRPILTYGCPVFTNCANTHLNTLQILQNKCLRMVSNAPFRTRVSLLHTKLGLETVKAFINRLTENFYKNSAKSSNKLVSRLGEYSTRKNFPKLKHRLPRPVPT